ncbi:MAG: sigma-54-dependent Fis family transcriptional regulator [Desulfobacterales bacterium]|nr:sigma-54-dependent Fis family transcriptional regulator [Desulfobacterales bacterium]
MGKALIIDSNQELVSSLSNLLSSIGHTVYTAGDLTQGWSQAMEHGVAAVVLASRLPDGDGLSLLPKLTQLPTPPEVVILDRTGDMQSAEFALGNGVWDYLTDFQDVEPVALSVDQAMQYLGEKTAAVPPVSVQRERIIGASPKMRTCFALMAEAVASNIHALIVGENGSGKELFARAIHSNGSRARVRSLEPAMRAATRRAEKNFVVADCEALPEILVDSVLFGQANEAFSEAENAQNGLIAQAHGGTLFLDEVGQLPLSTQKVLSRVLRERCYRPVGSRDAYESNFRMIAATSRDLDQLTAEGGFSAELLDLLRDGLILELPPLRARAEDIQELIRHHTHRLCKIYHIAPKEFSAELLDTLCAYPWPGNVRELIQAIDAMLAMAGDEMTLHAKHLPPHLRIQVVCRQLQEPRVNVIPKQSAAALPDFKTFQMEAERRYLEELLGLTGRNISRACAISGISRPRLGEMIAKYNLK